VFRRLLNTRSLCLSAVIAALYAALTLLLAPISYGNLQCRVSEALTILPYFTTAAIPGLWIGCILANFLTGCALYDIIFGSLATLLGAIGTYLIRKKLPDWCACIPPIIANVIIVPLVLVYGYGLEDGLPYLMLTVGIGEIISCGVLGIALLKLLKKYRYQIFGEN
jgi:uncharacterized membrane protein